MRHSDVLDIATMADFLGNVWQCNAIIVPTPMRNTSRCYLQPVAEVMRLFGAHQGKRAVCVDFGGNADVVASKTDKTIYLHLVNKSMTDAENITVDLENSEVESAKMYCISAEPDTEITPTNIDCFAETVTDINMEKFNLPKAAVAAVEIKIK